MERGVARSLRVVLVRDRRAESTMMPSPVNLSTKPSKRSTPFERIWKKRFMICDHSSASICPAISIEPLTSANSTVTCLRSPSRATREVRILSARCFGVYAYGAGAAAGVTVSGARHLRQNLAVGRLPAPQVGHAVSSGAPHSSQKAASDRFSVWHFGHFIGISPGAERTVSSGTALVDDVVPTVARP